MGARPEVGGQLIGRRPTLIVAEVVFAYIEEAQVNEMLSTLSDFFLDCGYLVYEMVRPKDPFGKMMVANLEDRGCPLRGIQATPEAQRMRFEKHGKCEFSFCEDMLGIY